MALDYRRFPVLVVDDEPDILRAFALTYRDEFEILTAEGGEEGLLILERHPVAVIVADQRMPRAVRIQDRAKLVERSRLLPRGPVMRVRRVGEARRIEHVHVAVDLRLVEDAHPACAMTAGATARPGTSPARPSRARA